MLQDFLIVDEDVLRHSFTQLGDLVGIAREVKHVCRRPIASDSSRFQRIHRHQLDVPKAEQQQQQEEEQEGLEAEPEQTQTLLEPDDDDDNEDDGDNRDVGAPEGWQYVYYELAFDIYNNY